MTSEKLTALALFVSGLVVAMIMPYQAIVGIEIFKITPSEYAVIVFASSIISVAASLAMGFASDRWGNRSQLLLIACSLVSVGYGLVWGAHSWLAFAIAHVMLIPFLGGVLPSSLQ